MKQGRIHDIRCVLILHYAIFSDFYKSVTDGPTDGPTDGRTDGRTDTPSYRDARTHLKTKEKFKVDKACFSNYKGLIWNVRVSSIFHDMSLLDVYDGPTSIFVHRFIFWRLKVTLHR